VLTLHPSVGPPQLLGEGGSSFAWLIHYTNSQMCAKCPKPNINKREISVFRCRFERRTLAPSHPDCQSRRGHPLAQRGISFVAGVFCCDLVVLIAQSIKLTVPQICRKRARNKH